jgi:hypothetical protein
MPQFGKTGSLPGALRTVVNHMFDENRLETEIADRITAISKNPETSKSPGSRHYFQLKVAAVIPPKSRWIKVD